MAHKWTEEEVAWMRANVPGKHRDESYVKFIEEFQIDITFDQYIGAIKRHKIRCGMPSKFHKGFIPANKGKKMSPEHYEKAKATMFQAGNRSWNELPIGAERDVGGYVWVKISAIPNVRRRDINWKPKHHIIWEKHHGPLQKGEVIIFLDNDKKNCAIENLEKITKSEHTMMNRKRLRYEEPELTKAGIATAKLLDTMYKRRNEKSEKAKET